MDEHAYIYPDWTISKTDTFPGTSFEEKKTTTKKQNSTPKDWKKIDLHVLSVKVYLLKIK